MVHLQVLELNPPAELDSKTPADILIFTMVKMGVGGGGAADSTLSQGASGTKLDFVPFCMLTVSR